MGTERRIPASGGNRGCGLSVMRQGFLEGVPSEPLLREWGEVGAGGWGGHGGHFGQRRHLEQKAQKGETTNRTVHSKNTSSSALLEVIVMAKNREKGLERLSKPL